MGYTKQRDNMARFDYVIPRGNSKYTSSNEMPTVNTRTINPLYKDGSRENDAIYTQNHYRCVSDGTCKSSISNTKIIHSIRVENKALNGYSRSHEEALKSPISEFYTAPSVSSHHSNSSCHGKVVYIKTNLPRNTSGTESIPVDINGHYRSCSIRKSDTSSSCSCNKGSKHTISKHTISKHTISKHSSSKHSITSSSSSSSSSSRSTAHDRSHSHTSGPKKKVHATPRDTSIDNKPKSANVSAGRTNRTSPNITKKGMISIEEGLEFGGLKPKFCFIGPRTTKRKTHRSRWACGAGSGDESGDYHMRSTKYLNEHKQKV